MHGTNINTESSQFYFLFFDVLLAVHLSIFISVINQLDAQITQLLHQPLHIYKIYTLKH